MFDLAPRPAADRNGLGNLAPCLLVEYDPLSSVADDALRVDHLYRMGKAKKARSKASKGKYDPTSPETSGMGSFAPD